MKLGILELMLLAAIGIILFCFWFYRRQVKDICEQIRFLNENDTNMMISTKVDYQEIRELAEEINNWHNKYTEEVQTFWKKEQLQKENFTNLSHDIRTPLTSLDGYFQMLMECDNEMDRQRYNKIIQGRIVQLKDMLEELFTYTKLQNKEYEMDMQEENIQQIVYETIFSFYELFKEHGITPEISCTDKKIYVNCNKAAMSRILYNIIKNAWVHGEKKIMLKTMWHKSSFLFSCKNYMQKGQNVELEKIFDRFYKADKARNYGSTGLGLAIAKELTQKMGGEIQAEIQEEWFEIKLIFSGYEVGGDKTKKTTL